MGKGKIVIWFICLSLVIYFLFINPRTHQEYSGDKLIVRLAIWGGLSEISAWDAMEKAFEAKYPEYDLNVEMVPLKYEEKMLRRLAANTAPDILTLSIADFASKDVLLDLTPFIDADSTASYDGYLPGIENVGIYRGKRYGFGGNVSTQILYYNKEHFKEAGIPTPNELYDRGEWNWATFRETAKKLTQRDKRGDVARFGFQFYPPVWNYVHMFGGKPFNEDFTTCYLTEPNTVKAFQSLADLILVDESAPPVQYEKQLGLGWQAFYNGKVSMFISGPYMINRLHKDNDKYFDVAPPPLEPGGRVAEVSGAR
ncbi:extracellular solute-binding protein, partial [bacterium]|nr:extracellular solute-binding protein [bacterium]